MVEIDTKSMTDIKTLGGIALIVVGGGLLVTSYRRFQMKEYWRMIGMGVVGFGLLYGGVQIFQGKTETAKEEVREEVKEKVITAIEESGEESDEDSESEAAEEVSESYNAEFTQSQREKLAKKGLALPDGSFPIRNKQDLHNAIMTWGLAKKSNKAAAKKFIKKRAKQLGAMNELPATW